MLQEASIVAQTDIACGFRNIASSVAVAHRAIERHASTRYTCIRNQSRQTRTSAAMRLTRQFRILVTLVMVCLAGTSAAQPADPIAPYRAIRDAFIEGYRVRGSLDRGRLLPAAAGLRALAAASTGELRARAMLELGTVERLQDQYAGAVAILTAAARSAEVLGVRDV